jgi:hypothetical protein
VFEAWERVFDVVGTAGAGAYEADDPVTSREVENGAAEEGAEGLAVPAFAD